MLSLFLLTDEQLTPLTEMSHTMILEKAGQVDTVRISPSSASATILAGNQQIAWFRGMQGLEVRSLDQFLLMFLYPSPFVYSDASFSLHVRELCE